VAHRKPPFDLVDEDRQPKAQALMLAALHPG
jgi:hypothetical protein